MTTPINLNGVTYRSVDEMPPDVRAQYEAMGNLLADKNQNGMPDLVENALQNNATVIQSSVIIFEGKTYARPEDLPPDARARYDQAMAQLANLAQNDAPDAPSSTLRAPAANVFETAPSPRAAPPNADGQGLGPIVVLAIVALGLVVILALMMFLLFAHKR